MDADGGDDLVLFSVDHADVAGAGIDDVNFVSSWIGRDARRLRPYRKSAHRVKRPQVDDRDGVALPVRDVGVLAVERPRGQAALVEIPPSAGESERNEDCDEEEFAQGQSYGNASILFDAVDCRSLGSTG